MKNTYTELYEKLSRLQWLLQRNHLHGQSIRGPFVDPTRGQGRVLAMLKLQPEISTKDLSYLLGIRQQSLNELLGKLERGGYITRTPSESDRRVMIVKLTEKGKNAQQEDTDYSGIFNCLTPEEQAAFGDYLNRIIEALEAKLSDDEDENMADWMEAARNRLGDKVFDRLMARRGGRYSWGYGSRGADDCGSGHGPEDGGSSNYNHEGCGHQSEFFGGFGVFGGGRGPVPGAERFSHDYDGPMPDDCGPAPFNGQEGPETAPKDPGDTPKDPGDTPKDPGEEK